jgi:membrane protease YdiL (CAAX protease family)
MTMRKAHRWSMDRLPKPLHQYILEHDEESAEPQRRRKQTVLLTAAAGSVLLGSSLRTAPGSAAFYRQTLVVAGIWTLGSLASGPLQQGRIPIRDGTQRYPLVLPVLTGVATFGVFAIAARVARHIPFLGRAISGVLRYAEHGRMPLVVLTTGANALAEEMFFRGALYSAVRREHAPVLISTAAYTAATAATGNPALTLAGAVMGLLFGLQRRATGGIQTSMLTHLTWSMLMLRYLPASFRRKATP